MPQSTHSLLSRIAAGERDALLESVDRYKELVWWLASRQMGEHAEEAVQEIFFNVWNNATRLDLGEDESEETTLVTTITRRTLTHLRRQFGNVARGTQESPLQNSVPLPKPRYTIKTTVVQRMLADELDDPERNALHLAVHAGLTHAQIAQQLNVSLHTVRNQLRSALEMVHARLSLENDTSQVGDGTQSLLSSGGLSSKTPTATEDRERFDILVLDEVTQGLGPAEHEELVLLLERANLDGAEEDGEGTETDGATSDDLLDKLHTTVARVELSLLTMAQDQSPSSLSSQMPALVEADLRRLATAEAKRIANHTPVPFEQASVTTLGLSPAWWIAAAALFLVLLAWWPHLPFTNIVTTPNANQEAP